MTVLSRWEPSVNLEIRGAFGEAVIRRVSYITDAVRAHYGMEYGHLSADFRYLVGGLVAGTHTEFDWQWTGSGISHADAATWAQRSAGFGFGQRSPTTNHSTGEVSGPSEKDT